MCSSQKLLLLLLMSFLQESAGFAQESSLFFADPTIFRFKYQYYLYGTGAQSDSGFHAMSSKNLKRWKPVNGGKRVLERGNNFGDKGFWAPHVFEHNGRVYMAYTANEHIAIAEATSAAGPFLQQVMKPLEAPVKLIDPFVFKDDDGTLYLYHVRLQDGNRIFSARLKQDLSGIEPESLTECISAVSNPQSWEDTKQVPWSVTEGPTVIKVGAQYLMLYSANDFRNPDYAVGYATAAHPLGPWKKSGSNPVISRAITGQNGSGHGDIIRTPKGRYYYVFHTHYSNTKVGPRRTAMIPLGIRVSGSGEIEVTADAKGWRWVK